MAEHSKPDKPCAFSFWRFAERILPWLGVLAAFAAVTYQHQDSKEIVRVQTAIEMIKLFDSTEMRRARRRFAGEQLRAKDPTSITDTRVLEFFETLASYREQDRIDDATIYSKFSYYIERYWVSSEPFVVALRKEQEDNSFYTGFEELNTAMLKEDSKKRNKPLLIVKPTADEVKEFLQIEAALTP
jgi:hypothetical protein